MIPGLWQQSKRASSNTRHGGSGRKRDKAKDTHRRGRLKPASPTVKGGSKGEEEKSQPPYLLPESDGDDEYLFMGATAVGCAQDMAFTANMVEPIIATCM